MSIEVGNSSRWGRGTDAPVHLVVRTGNHVVLACTGGAVKNTREVEHQFVLGTLTCGPCRTWWRRARDVAP